MSASGQGAAAARGVRAWIVTAVVLVQTSQSLAMVGVSLFLPLIRSDLGIGYGQAGLLAAASTATYALMQIPAGYLSDRFGAKRVYLVGAVGVNLLSFSFALLPTLGWLIANQAVSGVFRSFMFASGMLLVTRRFPSDRRATAMGLFVALGFSSNIFLNIFGPLLVDDLGWRTLFMIFSILGFLFVAFYLALPDRDTPGRDLQGVRVRDLLEIMRGRVLWICGGIQFVRLAVTMATMAWWPTYLVVEKGFDLTTAGLVLAVGAALTAPANICGGYVSDRFDRPLTVIVVSLLVVSGTFIGIIAVDELIPLVALIAINQFFLQIYFGPLFAIPVRALGTRFTGSINGFSNMFANIGALFAIFAMGWFKDLFGSFAIGLLLLVGLCGVSLALTALLRRQMLGEPPAVRGA
ncbi:nitrate/nitrite transporter [Leucobacter sp. wl10]|uniref:MFS transporter n=1 Tax=Leucobacter sp. wl10 TaxID=2304677 RepID=UPI000E5C1556|nr:MFS transporter [Leucobacter sp. wl10]RGE20052.1 MFS transporter [Leucobacter sp. wl10]